MEKNTANLHGALLINKPVGATSFDIVRNLRRTFGGLPREARRAKWGHSGTLDPFATGLLIILIGHATRLQDELHLLPKTYEAEITLGATSDTDDSTGIIRPFSPPYTRGSERGSVTSQPHPASPHTRGRKRFQPSASEVLSTLDHIQRQTSQIPPHYAAIKINGKRMYEYARAGESVEKKPRPIAIHDIVLKTYQYPMLNISVTCSTGTYIRSLARDIGELVGTGAYCSLLERTTIGKFTLENAISPEELPKVIHRAIIPMERLVSHIPSLVCSEDSVAKYKQGKVGECVDSIPINTPIALVDENKKLFGIGISETGTTIRPKKIFL